mgnify:CR=1 FL=1
MRRLLITIVSGILGIWLATLFIPGVAFYGSWKTLLLTGLILGLINFFIKPILNFITIPLRALTFGLFGLIINMGIIWIVDILFKELVIAGLLPLIWTTLLLWGLGFVLPFLFPKK